MNELQYKNKNDFYHLHDEVGKFNLAKFYSYFSRKESKNKKILDIGCGEGNDMAHFMSLGATAYGIDINSKAVTVAQARFNCGEKQIIAARANSLPFRKSEFDMISSQYVLQAIKDIDPVYKEVYRTLKKDGTFIFLVTHPFRQYFEKKNSKSDYFKQTTVDSVILNGLVTVEEPTHTFNDYFSTYFLKHFTIETYVELHDPTAEKVEERKYPGFFIVKARKK